MTTQAWQRFGFGMTVLGTALAIVSLSLTRTTNTLASPTQADLRPSPSNISSPQIAHAAWAEMIAQTGSQVAKTAEKRTIMDIAASNPSLTSIVRLLKAAGLDTTLSSQGSFTLFAPTNAAVSALPARAQEMLQKPENRDRLKMILSYHILPNAVAANALSAGEVTTLADRPVTVQIKNGNVKINGATITIADIQASNGVIHVVDRVIRPAGVRPPR